MLSNRQRYALIKLLALLSLVRWYNVLIVTIAMYLMSLFLLNDISDWFATITDIKLHLQIIAIAFFIKAGYIINAFYDFEKDMINSPKTTIFDRVISKTSCLRAYLIFLMIGTGISAMISLEIFIFNFSFSFMLWFYSHKLRKKILTGETSAAVLSIIPFLSLCLFYQEINTTIILYIGYIFAITVTREVIKKMVFLKGALIVGERSLPIVMGIRSTKYIILILMLLSLIPIGVLYPQISDRLILYYFILSGLLISASTIFLKFAKTPSQFDKINGIYKIITLLGVFSIPLV